MLKKSLSFVLIFYVFFVLVACNASESDYVAKKEDATPTGEPGELYETAVLRAFLDTTNTLFGLNDADYSNVGTDCVMTSVVDEGQLQHVYELTAFYAEGRHEINALAYYVPDNGREIKIVCIHLDGKELFHDGETDACFMGLREQ